MPANYSVKQLGEVLGVSTDRITIDQDKIVIHATEPKELVELTEKWAAIARLESGYRYLVLTSDTYSRSLPLKPSIFKPTDKAQKRLDRLELFLA